MVKQETPILVILGNPPYNGFAGMAVDEERELSEAYRTTKQVRRPEGQGLNDLYVRFFRMAERRIAEKTGIAADPSDTDSRSVPSMRLSVSRQIGSREAVQQMVYGPAPNPRGDPEDYEPIDQCEWPG